LSIGEAGTATTPSFEATTQPFSLRGDDAELGVDAQFASARVSKSAVWYSERSFGFVGEYEIDRAPLRINSKKTRRG